jgi:hypothetical protein
MPIRTELRHFYSSESWFNIRMLILKRAGGRFTGQEEYLGGAHCEKCGALDGSSYFNANTGRLVIVQLGIAHRDHEDLARFYDPDNLRALDRKCHLLFDLPFHRSSRQSRKDKERPILAAAISEIERALAIQREYAEAYARDPNPYLFQGIADTLMEEALAGAI